MDRCQRFRTCLLSLELEPSRACSKDTQPRRNHSSHRSRHITRTTSLLMHQVPSDGLHPFRLIAFSLPEQSIREWRVHARPETIDFPWEYRHWFSSGVGDDEAAKRRQKICAEALTQPDALSSSWVRRLHQSHGAEPGPYSICVHRETGGTLSYTEVETAATEVTMRYSPTSACKNQPMPSLRLPLRQTSSSQP